MRRKGLRGGRVQQGIRHIIIRKKFTEAEDLYPDTGLQSPPEDAPRFPGSLVRHGATTIRPEALLFRSKRDKFLFLSLLQQTAIRFHSRVLAFVLMDTHAHLLVQSNQISILIGTLCSRYAAGFHKKYATRGPLAN